jgi:UDP:flavonoid glycosyltransferase YjiC (YdhE family)
MAHILVATQSATAHVAPFATAVAALVKRGHQVTWYTGEAHRDRVQASGAEFAAPVHGHLDDMDALEEQYPEITGMNDAARAAWFIEHVLVAPAEGQYRDLASIVTERDVTAVLADSTMPAPGLLYELNAVLWATLSVAPLAIPDPDVPPYGMGWLPGRTRWHRLRNQLFERLGQRTVMRKPLAAMNTQRTRLGLRPVRATFAANATPYLYMQATAVEFEYPRSSLAGLPVHFVGPLFPDRPPAFDPPDWWPELDQRRVVLLTQGTSARDPERLIRPAIEALAGSDLLVVVTGQSPAGQSVLGPVPGNVRVAPFLPYHLLLPKVSVLVTNGGYGTVQMALAHGVPVVAAGKTEDKPEVCARVQWSGAGVYLRARTPDPGQIRQAVTQVLDDPACAAAAGRIAAAFAAHDAPGEIADLMERLITARAPVTGPRA